MNGSSRRGDPKLQSTTTAATAPAYGNMGTFQSRKPSTADGTGQRRVFSLQNNGKSKRDNLPNEQLEFDSNGGQFSDN